MFWLFALGIIWLAVIHEGFRKLLKWTIICSIALIAIGGMYATEHEKAVKAAAIEESHTPHQSGYAKLAALKDE